MAAINITNVQVLDNPTIFTNPFQFEIEYECLYDLKDDLEWKLIYVGSAETEKHDQVLDSVLVGPVYAGGYRFVFQANPPDVSKLPTEDVVGVTVVFLSCSYRGEEFIRVGYYDYITKFCCGSYHPDMSNMYWVEATRNSNNLSFLFFIFHHKLLK